MGMIQKRRQILSIAIFSLLFLAVLNCTIKEPAIRDKTISQIQAKENLQILQSGQTERQYLLYIPTSYNGNTPVPLVLGFHGSGGDPRGQLAGSDFANLAEGQIQNCTAPV